MKTLTMDEMCLSADHPRSNAVIRRFEKIESVKNPELRKKIARRIRHSDRSLGAIARIFLDEITRFSGYERPCVKFPVDVGHIPELVEWFPDCKIMHITRDPRAMAMSKTNDPFGTALRIAGHPRLAPLIRRLTILFVIIQYRWTARLHLRYKGSPNYRLFRYEDLLAAPDRTLREVCNSLKLQVAKRAY